MSRQGRYPQELRERAVHLVFQHQGEHHSQWAAITSIAHKFGVSAETLRKWVRRAEIDDGQRPGLTTDERQRFRELELENRELRRANEILKSASAFFAAELDRQPRRPATSTTRTATGSSRSARCCRSPRRRTTRPRPGRRRPGPSVTPD